MRSGSKGRQPDQGTQTTTTAGKLPLYEDESLNEIQTWSKCGKEAHTGLWYEKFCFFWNRKESKNGDEYLELGNRKIQWIRTVTGVKPGDGHTRLVEDMCRRMEALVMARGGHLLPVKTAGRFVTGLGRSHPVENGFAWHPTLGTAYLPGSSVKGLVRAWAEQWAGAPAEEIERIFGSKPGENNHRAGSVIFLDALPTVPVKLEAEVMTPHYPKYYQNRDKEKPRDWQDPNPIPFLTVSTGQSFLFAVMPRVPGSESSREDTEKAVRWLEEALVWIGAGAKTAVGYGRFEVDGKKRSEWERRRSEWERQRQEAERKRKEREALSRLSPIEREMWEDGYEKDEQRFMEALSTKWLNRMSAPDASGEDRLEIARLLAKWYQENKPDQWKKPKGKNIAKVELIKAALAEEGTG